MRQFRTGATIPSFCACQSLSHLDLSKSDRTRRIGASAKIWQVKLADSGSSNNGNDLSQLSKLLLLDEAALEFTIGNYNHFCREGVDKDFGRAADTLKAIAPPYYAMQLMPLLYNTQGGPRRDKQARVLDPDGNPIPRLFAAGEFGSIWGFRYQTSTNVSECLVFGRIAGRNAAMSAVA